jgi:hypothetical protein
MKPSSPQMIKDVEACWRLSSKQVPKIKLNDTKVQLLAGKQMPAILWRFKMSWELRSKNSAKFGVSKHWRDAIVKGNDSVQTLQCVMTTARSEKFLAGSWQQADSVRLARSDLSRFQVDIARPHSIPSAPKRGARAA